MLTVLCVEDRSLEPKIMVDTCDALPIISAYACVGPSWGHRCKQALNLIRAVSLCEGDMSLASNLTNTHAESAYASQLKVSRYKKIGDIWISAEGNYVLDKYRNMSGYHTFSCPDYYLRPSWPYENLYHSRAALDGEQLTHIQEASFVEKHH
ncbi:hypothetical protein BDZ91DRAFT_786122 [Kalaharituber pfeilii]|nr:hypothetical protein BDZ91DRAFT_786122 [Kalaharituber pfeilii]